jgi:retron-type reverse transcriptase
MEADIKGFFDNVEHAKLIGWLRIRIRDEQFVRYVVRFLKSGYMAAIGIHENRMWNAARR